jgi:hypothetical protein
MQHGVGVTHAYRTLGTQVSSVASDSSAARQDRGEESELRVQPECGRSESCAELEPAAQGHEALERAQRLPRAGYCLGGRALSEDRPTRFRRTAVDACLRG